MRAFFVVFGVLTYAALIASLPTFDSASDDILDTIDFVNEPVFNDDVADLADSNLGANEKQECNADATDTGSFNAKLRARGKVCRVRPSGNTKPKTPSNNNQDNTETAPIDLSNMPKPDSVPPNKKMCPNNLVGVCSEDYYLPLKAGEIIPFVKPAYQCKSLVVFDFYLYESPKSFTETNYTFTDRL